MIFAVPTVLQAFLDGFLTKNSTTPFVGLLFLLYSIGRYAEPLRLRNALLVLVPSLFLTLTVEVGFEGPADLVWLTFLFGLPVLAGRALRSRTLLQAELREKAEQAERDRADRAELAVQDERVRIASELQELVANGLSTMVVQAGAVPRAVESGDTARAGTALAAVETTGREALTEMRTLLGVLRREGDAAKLAPQPGLGAAGGARRAHARAAGSPSTRPPRLAARAAGRHRPDGVPRRRGRARRGEAEQRPRGRGARPLPTARAAAAGHRRPPRRRLRSSLRGSATASGCTAAICARSGSTRAASALRATLPLEEES